jgi:hypothetical protein
MALVQKRANAAKLGVPHVAAVATSVVAIAILISAAVVAIAQSDLGDRGTTATSAVTDGWLPAITSANAAQRAALAAATTDGWSVRYLSAAPAADAVTDGWASRYLDGAR